MCIINENSCADQLSENLPQIDKMSRAFLSHIIQRLEVREFQDPVYLSAVLPAVPSLVCRYFLVDVFSFQTAFSNGQKIAVSRKQVYEFSCSLLI